ncbi:MAG TPA: hypothetical protein VM009_00840 [Terriglobales bacterium]|nr:hypothetical protein [Terriglobales bacterium]
MDPLKHHNAEMGRAAAAAMHRQYQDTIEICAELLTSGTYDELARQDKEISRRAKAEVRLMMATAMHYTDGHYEDIVKQLSLAMDSPPLVQKDACFTLAVVQLSFGHAQEAKSAMEQCLAILAELRRSNQPDVDGSLAVQQQEAEQFLRELATSA